MFSRILPQWGYMHGLHVERLFLQCASVRVAAIHGGEVATFRSIGIAFIFPSLSILKNSILIESFTAFLLLFVARNDMQLPLHLPILTKGANVVLLVGNITENRHHLQPILSFVALGLLRRARRRGAEEFRSLIAHQIRAVFHLLQMKNKLKLLIGEIDEFGTEDVGPSSLGGVAV
jgi:hypothetical protein